MSTVYSQVMNVPKLDSESAIKHYALQKFKDSFTGRTYNIINISEPVFEDFGTSEVTITAIFTD